MGSPSMDQLLQGIERKQKKKAGRFLRQISDAGRREILGAVTGSNARSFLGYLARAEGRRVSGCVPSDSLPLMEGEGGIVGRRKKCERKVGAFSP